MPRMIPSARLSAPLTLVALLTLASPLLASRAFGADCTERAWYADIDRDGFGDPATRVLSCFAPRRHVSNGLDCDDASASVSPSASEVCNAIDDNCDRLIDNDASDASTWYPDADGDRFGAAEGAILACRRPIGYLADSGDCDDTRAQVNPKARERCNDLDDDCDAMVDEDAVDMPSWYLDGDLDGFGAQESGIASCDALIGRIRVGGDCDDDDALVSPGAEEICSDGIDNDCDGGSGACTFSGELDKTDLDVSIDLAAENDWEPAQITALGDTNGDGADELLVSSLSTGYVFEGPVLEDQVLDDASAVITTNGLGGGFLLEGLGDVNGDGNADLLDIQGSKRSPDYATVLFGALEGWIPRELEDNPGLTGALYTESASGSRDLSGDGIDDLVLVEPDILGYASTLVILDGPVGVLSEDLAGAPRIHDLPTCYDLVRLSYGGDLNGDGIGDLVVGIPQGAPSGYVTDGRVLVFYGPFDEDRSASDADAELLTEDDSLTGYRVDASSDLNADGIADLVVSAPALRVEGDDAMVRVGAVYVEYGPIAGEIDLALADVRILGLEWPESELDPADPLAQALWLGSELSTGDIDGDGKADLMIGSEWGSSYLFLGPIEEGSTLDDARATFNLGARSGGFMGDLDGDGLDDLSFLVPVSASSDRLAIFYGFGL